MQSAVRISAREQRLLRSVSASALAKLSDLTADDSVRPSFPGLRKLRYLLLQDRTSVQQLKSTRLN